jgi:hypothetical protein
MATLKMCGKIVKLLRFFINEKLYTFGGTINLKVKKDKYNGKFDVSNRSD